MNLTYTPSHSEYKNIGAFRFWCQKVLPLVYDDSLSYYETLCKVVGVLNDLIKNVSGVADNVESMYSAFDELQKYMNNYFDNLDVQNEINNKLNEMAASGELSELINNLFNEYTRIFNGELANTNERIDDEIAVVNDKIDRDVRVVSEKIDTEISAVSKTVDIRLIEISADFFEEIKAIKGRMDSFTTLQTGSTTGDAELIDARTGFDGKIYSNVGTAVRNQIADVSNTSTIGLSAKVKGRNLVDYITIPGAIDKENGEQYNTDNVDSLYCCSPFIPVSKGDVIQYRNLCAPTNFAIIGIYDATKSFVTKFNGQGKDKKESGKYVIKFDGYIRLTSKISELDVGEVKLITDKKTLNILVLGNSFSQDSFAYLPPVLNEILDDYSINYGIAYFSGASFNKHLELYENNEAYTWFNYWGCYDSKWNRYTGDSGYTLNDIMKKHAWDIIYVQADGSASSVVENVVTPGRELLRILQILNGGRFVFLTGQWLATSRDVTDITDRGQHVFVSLCNAMQTIKQKLGVNDYIPIGTAIQNARTNNDLNDDSREMNMLYNVSLKKDENNEPTNVQDGGHMQSGIAALIATYTIALKILECVGVGYRGIYGSSFVPTTENCIAIGAYKAEGMTTPYPMTHGESYGATPSKIRAAQEIAVMAVKCPSTIVDCSDFILE